MDTIIGAVKKMKCTQNISAACVIVWKAETSTLMAKVTLKDCVGGPLWQGDISLDVSDIARQVRAALEKRAASGGNVAGWGWGDLKRSALRITRKLGVRKLSAKIKELASDPRFRQGASMALALYPPLGISYGMVRQAATLVEAASKKDPKALYRIATVAIAARDSMAKATEGGEVTPQDKERILFARALTALHAAKKGGVDVQGWAWNLPYRGPIEATNFDRSPGNLVRSSYARGIRRLHDRGPRV